MFRYFHECTTTVDVIYDQHEIAVAFDILVFCTAFSIGTDLLFHDYKSRSFFQCWLRDISRNKFILSFFSFRGKISFPFWLVFNTFRSEITTDKYLDVQNCCQTVCRDSCGCMSYTINHVLLYSIGFRHRIVSSTGRLFTNFEVVRP